MTIPFRDFLLPLMLWLPLLVITNNVRAEIPQPYFNHDSGFINAEYMQLMIAAPTPGAEIYYTLDGSEPDPHNSENSFWVYQNYDAEESEEWIQVTHEYSGTIEFHYDDIPASGHEHINTYYEGDEFQPPEEPLRAIVIRAVAHHPDYGTSDITNATYFLHPQATQLFDLPVFSIITDPAGLYDHENGIYVGGDALLDWMNMNHEDPRRSSGGNYKHTGREWEREAHLHFFDDGNLEIDQNIGVRIHGNNTRSYRRKSLRLYARSDYGNNTFDYEFFPGLELKGNPGQAADSFKRLILRASGQDGGNDPHEYYDYGETSTQIRDALSQKVMAHFPGVEYQAYEPAVHFINGIYWGIINIRERHDHWYFSQHYGIDEEDLVMLTNEKVHHGNPNDINDYYSIREIINDSQMSDQAKYEELTQRIDIQSLMYYNLGNLYIGHSYWPHGGSDDTRYWRKRVNPLTADDDLDYGHDGKWRWTWKDMDKSFTESHFDMYQQLSQTMSVHTTLTHFLWNNDEHRQWFLNTLQHEVNTTFHPDRLLYVIDSMNDRIAEERNRHEKRWNAGNDEPDAFRDFARERQHYFLEHTQNRFGLSGYAEVEFEISHPQAVHLNINGFTMHPDNVRFSGNPLTYPWKGYYFEDMEVEVSADITDTNTEFIGWRVDDSNELIRSETVTFYPGQTHRIELVLDSDIPQIEQPQLIFPTENDVVVGAIDFQWANVDEADEYELEISKSETFSSIKLSKTFSDNYAYLDDVDISYPNLFWRVRGISDYMTGPWSDPEQFTYVLSGHNGQIPEEFEVYENFPNPFNPKTIISFFLPEQQQVTITVHDITGRQIQTLTDEVYSSGTHYVRFNADNLASGVYLYRVHTGERQFVRKMILLK